MSTQSQAVPSDLKLNQTIANITVGFVIGLIDVIVVISFGALVFSGDLAAYVPLGINLLLFGGALNCIIVTLTTSFTGMISVSQDSPAALLGIELSVIGASLAVGPDKDILFYTALAAIAVTTLLTGIVFILLGKFKLGVLVRYLPFPVVAGFLAGTGWFVFKGGLEIAADANLKLSMLGAFFSLDPMIRWLPALAAGVLFYWATRRFSQFWLLPALFFAVVLAFYLVIVVSGSSVPTYQSAGWFLQPFGKEQTWRPVLLEAVPRADWGWVFRHLIQFIPVSVVSVIAMLLNVSALELTIRKDINLDHELQASGFSNIFNALVGNIVSFPTLSLSVLAQRSGKPSRLIGFFAAGVMLVVLVFGSVLLAFVPKFAVGGLLIFLGIDFMADWLVAAYSRLTRFEYAIIWIILITMSAVGVLEGVGIGLLLALGLFVYNYSRTKVVKHTFTGGNYHSNVDRPQFYSRILHQNPGWMHILELQGYLFFGTTVHIYQAFKERLTDDDKQVPEYFVLDFRQVVGMDASAIQNFQRTLQLMEECETVVVFSALSEDLMRQLEKNVLTEDNEACWQTFVDLDHAVEWCEDQKIEVIQRSGLDERTGGTEQQIELLESHKERLAGLVELLGLHHVGEEPQENSLIDMGEGYLEAMVVPAGETLIWQGEVTKGLYFIESGITSAELKDATGNVKRLRKMQPGTVVGEVGLYSSEHASASVIAQEECQVYFLSREKLQQMEKEDQEAAAELHRFIAELLSYRISTSTHTIHALLD
ncbi:MAG TPA: SulP family inorganic anion transporter [Anaerolineales bacterium]|nr:SulP family inorganic anion transporter [Anaerolineales bacterium]